MQSHTLAQRTYASQGALGDSKRDTRRSARSLKIRSSPLACTYSYLIL